MSSATSYRAPAGGPARAGAPTAGAFAPRRLALAAGAALAGSLAGVLAIRAAATSGVDVAGFQPLAVGPEISLTVLGVLLAAAVCMRLNGRTERPLSAFRWIAAGALLLSLVPDLGLWVSRAYPHTGANTVLPLMAMHATVGLICIVVLPWLGRDGAVTHAHWS